MNKMMMIIDADAQLDFSRLTKYRVPGAIPLFSKYRMIDFPLSNATNSGITNVGIFCSRLYRSLQDHIGSGERYDLDRRKDGVFLLPPKTSNPVDELFISFRRMAEHHEFFRRSTQEYCVIMPATLITTEPVKLALDFHIESGVDITEIVSSDGTRLFAYIMKKSMLMNYIENYNRINYRNVLELFDYSHSITKNTYKLERYARFIRSLKEYYDLSFEILNKDDELLLLRRLSNIKTKEQLNGPTYYGPNAEIKNSLVSAGSSIDALIEDSMISRRCDIGTGAIIKNSIIMNNCIIEDDAVIENAIIDKETRVVKGAVIKGTIDMPFVSEKRQILHSSLLPKVAIMTVELMPYVKRGGLADMVGSLSLELSRLGADVKVFLPLYKEIRKNHFSSMAKASEITLTIDKKEYRISVYKIEKESLTYYFIDLYMFFDRDEVYGYEDDPYRYAYYTYAALEFMNQENMDIDIFHFHDWHTCLTPIMKKKYERYRKSTSILTIHNLNYQGEVNKRIVEDFGLDYYVNGDVFNFLEAGIYSCDEVTTVSKTYAEELKFSYFSKNLKEAIIRRSDCLYGIVNGLSSRMDPKSDLMIKMKYDRSNVLEAKPVNKRFLAETCGFKYSSDMFIIGMVSRINETKGFDIVLHSLPEILTNENIYFVCLGVGDKWLMNGLSELEKNYPGRVRCFLDFNGTRPEYIYSGADCFLMPSKIEPCGTSQMIAMKYGTVPIVRQTGGLNDTVLSFDRISRIGNGYKFYNPDSREMIAMVGNAYDTFKQDKDAWNNLIDNCMKEDNSFVKCAKEYINLYNLNRKRNK